MDKIIGTLQEIGMVQGTLSGVGAVSGSLSVPKGKAVAPFVGDYNYIPTQQTQTIEINGLRATDNITIEPIPNNYGLITWNGSVITVS